MPLISMTLMTHQRFTYIGLERTFQDNFFIIIQRCLSYIHFCFLLFAFSIYLHFIKTVISSACLSVSPPLFTSCTAFSRSFTLLGTYGFDPRVFCTAQTYFYRYLYFVTVSIMLLLTQHMHQSAKKPCLTSPLPVQRNTSQPDTQAQKDIPI